MKYLSILGRQPEISLAELEVVLGPQEVEPFGDDTALLGAKVDINRLGGCLKIAQVTNTVDSLTINDLEAALKEQLKESEGKINIGISQYGENVFNPKKLSAELIGLKKKLKSKSRSIRIVPNKESSLSTAQVFHNKLTQDNGLEILIVKGTSKIVLAKTIGVQDIDAYAARDRDKPVRDMQVGMLPPKLAQIVINLSGAGSAATILDPFCGTGTILIEALNMGLEAQGSDVSAKEVKASIKNVDWYKREHELENEVEIEESDATEFKWSSPFTNVACETFLGPALSAEPDKNKLEKIVSEVNDTIKKFLENLADQTNPGTGICVAIPAWYTRGVFRRLPLVDDISKLGYNRLDLTHSDSKNLIYHRKGQIVGRELLILRRI